MDYSQSVSYLYALGHEVLAAKYGLESIRRLLDALGRPDRSFASVLVAGTNGKGSTAAMIESAARAAGHRTALYTSPHLVRLEERLQVAGKLIPPNVFARYATQVRHASEGLVQRGLLDAPPTFFEQVTAIALAYFRDARVNLAILEVGLGGRLDATNAVNPLVSVITAIDYDHQAILGTDIRDIAGEKAAIIKRGGRAVLGRQPHQAAANVLMHRCLEEEVLPVFVNEPTGVTMKADGRLSFDYESAGDRYSRVLVGLRGRHQADNAAAAIETCELLTGLGFEVRREAIIKGLREVNWPGRLEWVAGNPALLLDGAHNPAGARALRQYLEGNWRGPLTLIFGAMADKDVGRMAAELFPLADLVICTRVNDPRAATDDRLMLAPASAAGLLVTGNVAEALAAARRLTPADGLICVTGSLHLVGEVKRLLTERGA